MAQSDQNTGVSGLEIAGVLLIMIVIMLIAYYTPPH